jgi:hypothetical protein
MSCGTALTVPAVPTGMYAGVSRSPCAVEIRPRRAGPAWASIVNGSVNRNNILLVQCYPERSEGSAPLKLGGSHFNPKQPLLPMKRFGAEALRGPPTTLLTPELHKKVARLSSRHGRSVAAEKRTSRRLATQLEKQQNRSGVLCVSGFDTASPHHIATRPSPGQMQRRDNSTIQIPFFPCWHRPKGSGRCTIKPRIQCENTAAARINPVRLPRRPGTN